MASPLLRIILQHLFFKNYFPTFIPQHYTQIKRAKKSCRRTCGAARFSLDVAVAAAAGLT
ncbi:hypothetical protein HMPREF0868_1464 [Mageeibacillus indolicus UPII9-5]|uniref:Uncharacterized protein n=1 Tax=Mageeibacillus indolicus (strain UPII9-5) TaxID=699246 RepID=D3QZ34_MAGIU|nr:hypothetical protein HMPREF0868_1464 [Mageeibacillus indolicus UPII9-5]